LPKNRNAENIRVKRSLFILNPNAGIIPARFIITKKLEMRKKQLSWFKTLSIDESGSLIRNSFDNYDLFIAAGGDGTVRSVATELIGTNKIFGVLPMGSGNGFAREMGFRSNIEALLSDIRKSDTSYIDVLNINGHNCLNVTGVGLDSFVAHSFDKLKTRGFWSYVRVTWNNFRKLKPVDITLRLPDGTQISEKLFVLTIANTRQFGNNAFIAPDAKPNDGIMDIVMVKPFPKILAPVFIFRLFTGTLNKSSFVEYIKTEGPVSIITDEKRFHLDGEPVSLTGEIVVSLQRGALSVLRTRHNKVLK
jgi:diacylglycerol kinase (ATP)